MTNKIDYSEEIRNLIDGFYEPVLSAAHENEMTEKKTLSEIHKDVIRVLPAKWIEESDVYEALQELGFKTFIYTADEGNSTDDDYVDGETHLAYFLNRK
tara:strand:+ start:280 stop:576 length:297 start_codon:yes stop_codon:yes gene_type:complete